MTLQEAKNTLDSVMPAPGNKMVDSEHLQIAVAWQEIKKTLTSHKGRSRHHHGLESAAD